MAKLLGKSGRSRMHPVTIADAKEVNSTLAKEIFLLDGKSILITGAGGFLGHTLLNILKYANDAILARPCKIVAVDNFISGLQRWDKQLVEDNNFRFVQADVSREGSIQGKYDFMFHLASIASPIVYRQYPIETIKVNSCPTNENNLLAHLYLLCILLY